MVREGRRHVLLVGIDCHPQRALRGCVNDIDAVQRLILDARLAPPEQIRRLASPEVGAAHDTTVPEQPATLGNLRGALAELGSHRVSRHDRVFIYYPGHGARFTIARLDGARVHRQALVPIDYDARTAPDRLLYDFELNAQLRAIAARTTAVTLVLDSCRAAVGASPCASR